MKDRYLYLLGGNSFQAEANRDFVERAGGQQAKITLCIINSKGWQQYVPLFKKTWDQFGVKNVEVVVPGEDDTINLCDAKQKLLDATGIFIGGGDTLVYHQHYASGQIGELVKEHYQKGVPVAGNSAGALILPEYCVISPEDNAARQLIIKDGLGLVGNVLISVHYSEWNDHPNLISAMLSTNIHDGLGIDENACAVFVNEKYHYAHGQYVHKINN